MCALVLMLGVSAVLFVAFPPAGIVLFLLVVVGHFCKIGGKKKVKVDHSNGSYKEGYADGYADAEEKYNQVRK